MADSRIDRPAVVFGLFFAVAGVGFLLDGLDIWTLKTQYLGPLALIALGIALLLAGRRSSGSRP